MSLFGVITTENPEDGFAIIHRPPPSPFTVLSVHPVEQTWSKASGPWVRPGLSGSSWPGSRHCCRCHRASRCQGGSCSYHLPPAAKMHPQWDSVPWISAVGPIPACLVPPLPPQAQQVRWHGFTGTWVWHSCHRVWFNPLSVLKC